MKDADRKGLGWQDLSGGSWIQIEIPPSRDLGAFREDIKVATDHPTAGPINLSVTGTRVGPISVTPLTVRMLNVRPDKGGETTLLVKLLSATTVKPEIIEVPEGVTVRIAPLPPKTVDAPDLHTYKMIVAVPEGTPSGVITGSIVLRAEADKSYQIAVPVTISVVAATERKSEVRR